MPASIFAVELGSLPRMKFCAVMVIGLFVAEIVLVSVNVIVPVPAFVANVTPLVPVTSPARTILVFVPVFESDRNPPAFAEVTVTVAVLELLTYVSVDELELRVGALKVTGLVEEPIAPVLVIAIESVPPAVISLPPPEVPTLTPAALTDIATAVPVV